MWKGGGVIDVSDDDGDFQPLPLHLSQVSLDAAHNVAISQTFSRIVHGKDSHVLQVSVVNSCEFGFCMC